MKTLALVLHADEATKPLPNDVERSRGHVAFYFSEVNGAWYEVVQLGATWKDVCWAPLSCVMDVRALVRCGLRPAPLDVIEETGLMPVRAHTLSV